MSNFVKNIFLISIAIVLVPLSVANRHPVNLSLNPFDPSDPRLTITGIPLFWIIFASLGLGLVIGGIGSWLKQGKWRKEARVKSREAQKWHKEAEQLREVAQAQVASASSEAKGLPSPEAAAP